MPETGKVSEYLNELTAEPADDDLFDVTVLISTAPDVWQSQKMRYEEIKNAAEGVAIDDDLIVIGTGTGIEGSTGKAGGIVGDEMSLYIAQKDFFNGDDYAFWQGDGGDSQMNAPSGNIAVISIDNQPKISVSDGVNSGVELGFGSSDVVRVGGTGGDAKLQIKSIGNDDGRQGCALPRGKRRG